MPLVSMWQIFVPFIVVSSSNDTVIQCEMAENREDVFFNFRWGDIDFFTGVVVFGLSLDAAAWAPCCQPETIARCRSCLKYAQHRVAYSMWTTSICLLDAAVTSLHKPRVG